MQTAKQVRDLCALVTLASDETEFQAAIAKLQRALREHTLQMENLQTKATLEFGARRRQHSDV